MTNPADANSLDGVAIIGMSGRFPGARDVGEFWKNLKAGVESISHFTPEELEVPDAELLAKRPDYVMARSVLDDADMFDASFFGIYPKDAELIDPQHRVFLECCWHAFEDSGYDPLTYSGSVGVFAGCSTNTYFLRQLCHNREFIENYAAAYQVGNYPTMIGNNVDFLSTRVAYKLNLRGPAFTLLAGCATSLIAVAQACQNLLTFQCDMALAGGASITFPQKRGYLYQPDGMVSPDGHCRAFDERAQGTVFGAGAAVVLLKRLEDAVADGDVIYAVVKGSAVTNDGSAKVGFAAPGVEGQASAIALAQAAAGVHPDTISYIEAHGTGTPLGDPIEIAALTKAFRSQTQAKQYCAIGSAKSNFGHLDIAAGVTGLIKTALALHHQTLPPTLHFERPNPAIDLENSPFYVNTKLRDWEVSNGPRRAGVSAFGVGGGNAHVVLEESPERPVSERGDRPQLLLLSAKTESALEAATANLAEYLGKNPAINLADVAYTLQVGRHGFEHRRMLVTGNGADAVQVLERRDSKRVFMSSRQVRNAEIAFMFPGQGAQYPNMGRAIYAQERAFREQVDLCSEILKPHLGLDLRTVLYPSAEMPDGAQPQIGQTVLAQPALFVTEYALARLWMSWGIRPSAMIGHSIGEFVAACLAGVFTLEEALALVAARGRMMQDLPGGSMLSVRLPEREVRPLLNGHLSIAAVNSPSLCVIAGPTDAVENLETQLGERGVISRRLQTSHAFHSAMMDPITGLFTERVKQVRLRAPAIPYVSGVTGNWITEAEATDPSYWSRHFRQPVLFSQGVQTLQSAERILLEVGPGLTLTTLARQHSAGNEPPVISSLPNASADRDEAVWINQALGHLWLAGIQPDWAAVHSEARRRISLPVYPFERKRYWFEAPKTELPQAPRPTGAAPALGTHTADSLQPSEEIKTAMADLQSPTLPAPSREERFRADLRTMFEELSGLDLSNVDRATTFLELGFDSLFLTQVTQELQNKFSVKITFRQLLDQESTLDALAAFLDARVAPDAAPAVGQAAAAPQPAPVLPEVSSLQSAAALPASAVRLSPVTASTDAGLVGAHHA